MYPVPSPPPPKILSRRKARTTGGFPAIYTQVFDKSLPPMFFWDDHSVHRPFMNCQTGKWCTFVSLTQKIYHISTHLFICHIYPYIYLYIICSYCYQYIYQSITYHLPIYPAHNHLTDIYISSCTIYISPSIHLSINQCIIDQSSMCLIHTNSIFFVACSMLKQ